MNINICIPVYNEEENLPTFIQDLNKFIKDNETNKFRFEVVFYNDGSTDKSMSILKNEKFTILSELNNKGLGYAINQLFMYSKTQEVDGVIKLDCDGQMDIFQINSFLELINKNNPDLIQGNRFNISDSFRLGLIKKIGMLFFRTLFKILGIKIADTTNGFIFVSKKWLEDYKIIGNYNAAQQIILDTKLRGLDLMEIDVKIKNRKAGKSFIGIRYPVNVISSMVALILFRKSNKLLIAPGIIILLSGVFVFINDLVLWMGGKEDKIISNNIVIFLFFIGLQMISFGVIIEFLKKQKII
jgi:glycosyltransferase involved in cell wall biosynthesis